MGLGIFNGVETGKSERYSARKNITLSESGLKLINLCLVCLLKVEMY